MLLNESNIIKDAFGELPEYEVVLHGENMKYVVIDDGLNIPSNIHTAHAVEVILTNSDMNPISFKLFDADLIEKFKEDYNDVKKFKISHQEFIEKYVKKIPELSNRINLFVPINFVDLSICYIEDKVYSQESQIIVQNIEYMLSDLSYALKKEVTELLLEKLNVENRDAVEKKQKFQFKRADNYEVEIIGNKDSTYTEEKSHLENLGIVPIDIEQEIPNLVGKTSLIIDTELSEINAELADIGVKPKTHIKDIPVSELNEVIPIKHATSLLDTIPVENEVKKDILKENISELLRENVKNLTKNESNRIENYIKWVINKELSFVSLFAGISTLTSFTDSKEYNSLFGISAKKLEQVNVFLINGNYIQKCVKIQCIGSDIYSCYSYLSDKLTINQFKILMNYFIARENSLDEEQEAKIKAEEIFNEFFVNCCGECFTPISLEYLYDLYVDNKLFTINYYMFNQE